MLEQGNIHLLSYMDHTPGQGQYAEPGSYEKYRKKMYGISKEKSGQIISRMQENKEQINWTRLREIAYKVKAQGVSLASHDDDTTEKVDFMMSCGLTISEFPINLNTALYARSKGIHTAVGAPNIVRGASISKNMRAMDAILADAANIICSDYNPSSMLPAVFKALEEGVPLPKAVRMVSLNVAQALGIADRHGSLETGKQADLLIVENYEGYPLLRRTMVEGCTIYKSEYRNESLNA
jgi:alpha-D-ribose 1-methylphosphonate 5-triphosphate diphosphatase